MEFPSQRARTMAARLAVGSLFMMYNLVKWSSMSRAQMAPSRHGW
jgi:hypothetical protein